MIKGVLLSPSFSTLAKGSQPGPYQSCKPATRQDQSLHQTFGLKKKSGILHQASPAPKTQASLPQNEKAKPSALALNTEIELVSKHLESYLSLQSMIQDLNIAIERSTKLNEGNQKSIDLFKEELDYRDCELKEKKK